MAQRENLLLKYLKTKEHIGVCEKSYVTTCMDPWQLLLPSEIFSRVMQDCHYHADIVRILAENKAVAVRRFK